MQIFYPRSECYCAGCCSICILRRWRYDSKRHFLRTDHADYSIPWSWDLGLLFGGSSLGTGAMVCGGSGAKANGAQRCRLQYWVFFWPASSHLAPQGHSTETDVRICSRSVAKIHDSDRGCHHHNAILRLQQHCLQLVDLPVQGGPSSDERVHII